MGPLVSMEVSLVLIKVSIKVSLVVSIVREIFLWAVYQIRTYSEMCSGSEAGSYVRLIDSCITQL